MKKADKFREMESNLVEEFYRGTWESGKIQGEEIKEITKLMDKAASLANKVERLQNEKGMLKRELDRREEYITKLEDEKHE